MKERPILFKGPMVRSILDGTKTQTRRLVNLPMAVGILGASGWRPFDLSLPDDRVSASHFSPYGAPGDRLWVRETWSTATGNGHRTVYRADVGTDRWPATVGAPAKGVWKPSIHMKRAVSRITLEVTSVRVERLHAITEFDAIAEGVEMAGERLERWRNYSPPEREGGSRGTAPTARESFFSLWEAIHGTESLAANPWLWVIGFKRLEEVV